MADRLFSKTECFDQSPALVLENGDILTHAELCRMGDDAMVATCSQRLLIAIEMANTVEAIAVYVGALRAGHVVIPFNPGDVAQTILERFQPNLVFSRRNGAWAWTRGNSRQLDLHPDLAVLLSTSGSTGSPKLVRLSHTNLFANAASIADYLDFRAGERAISSLPLYYSYGLSVLHSHLLFGHSYALTDTSISDEAFWDCVDRQGVTSIAGVPHSYDLLLHSAYMRRSFPSLRYFTQAGGKLSDDKIRQIAEMAEANGQRFYVMYGQTEAAPRIAYLPARDTLRHAGHIGCAVPGGDLKLEPTDAAADLEDGVGELVYRGANVMMGYAHSTDDLKLPQGPDTLHTGDLAIQNMQTGYFRIVGRTSRFAKLFGLRISYDAVEQRLADTGIVAAVTGDDDGLTITAVSPVDAGAIKKQLASDLGLPVGSICVAEVDAIPRLPTGKTDYRAVLRLREPSPASPEPVPVSTSPHQPSAGPISLAFADLLGLSEIDPSLSFAELGGDSLNYVQALLVVEELLEAAPDNWIAMPVAELDAAVSPTTPETPASATAASGPSVIGLDLARSIAILAALLSHCQTQLQMRPWMEAALAMRLSTPMLIILFGAMIPLLHQPRAEAEGARTAYLPHLSKAMTCYVLFALNVAVAWALYPEAWKFALLSLGLMGATPYSQILIYYMILFLMIPVVLFLMKRVNFWILFALCAGVHLAFLQLKAAPPPPELAGQPILQRLTDLFIGAGDQPRTGGPSILHSLILLLAGVWLGQSLRTSLKAGGTRIGFFARMTPMLVLFGAGAALSFMVPGFPVDAPSLAGMELRNLNHPAYIFIIGGSALAVVTAILLAPGVNKAPDWLLVIGRRSLFGFGVGNAFILLAPPLGHPSFSRTVDVTLLFAAVLALIYAYDNFMRTPAGDANLLSRAAQRLTSGGERAITAIAGLLLGAKPPRPSA